MVHAMLDFETMSLSANAAVLQAGACKFDLTTGEVSGTFKRGISLIEEQELGFEIDAGTVLWWLQQSKEAQESVSYNEASSRTVFTELNSFLHEADFVWVNGTLDPLWLNNHEGKFGLIKTPHWKFCNMKTLRALGYEPQEVEPVGVSHDALDDCLYQVKQIVSARTLGRRGNK